jgi:hypothetical protein
LILFFWLVGNLFSLGRSAAEVAVVASSRQPAPEEERYVDRVKLWSGRIVLGALGDSNPALLSEEISLSIPESRKALHGGDADSAETTELGLALYPFARGDQERPWHLGLSLDARQSLYDQVDYFDAGEMRATAHLARGSSPSGFLRGPGGASRVPIGLSRSTLLFQAGASETTLDRDPYFSTSWESASFGFRPHRSYGVQVDLEATDRRFEEEPAIGRRSGSEWRAALVQTLYLRRENRTLRLSAETGRRAAGRPFSGEVLRGEIELTLPLGTRANLLASATAQRDRYSHRESDLYFTAFNAFDPEFTDEEHHDGRMLRRDRLARGALALDVRLRASLHLIGRASWVDHSSNLRLGGLKPLDYRRTLTSLGVAWSF